MERTELINKLRIANGIIIKDYERFKSVVKSYVPIKSRNYFFRAIILVYASLFPTVIAVEIIIRILSLFFNVDLHYAVLKAQPIFVIFFAIIWISTAILLIRKTRFFATSKYAYYIIDKTESDLIEQLKKDACELSIIPTKYWHPEAFQYILGLFEKDEVKTIPQALTMYDFYENENYYKRWKIIDYYFETYDRKKITSTVKKALEN